MRIQDHTPRPGSPNPLRRSLHCRQAAGRIQTESAEVLVRLFRMSRPVSSAESPQATDGIRPKSHRDARHRFDSLRAILEFRRLQNCANSVWQFFRCRHNWRHEMAPSFARGFPWTPRRESLKSGAQGKAALLFRPLSDQRDTLWNPTASPNTPGPNPEFLSSRIFSQINNIHI